MYFETIQLLTGAASPATGSYVPAARARSMTVTFYGTGISGPNVINLYHPSPFNTDDVKFFSASVTDSTYYTTGVIMPVGRVKAISTGIGNFWAAVTLQD